MLTEIEKLFQKSVNIYRLQEFADHLVTGVASSNSRFALTSALILKMHAIAMDRLLEQPGQFRREAVHLTNCPHEPPSWLDVDTQIESLCRYVNDKWDERDLVHLSAFVMWRLNWIHPFVDGNGRISRALSYLVLCAKFGRVLPSKNSIVEQIVGDRQHYYSALRQCDICYDTTKDVDQCVEPLSGLMSNMLVKQLQTSFESE